MPRATPTRERKEIIVFPRGTLDQQTKALLDANGYLGIEADDPQAVVRVLPLAPMAAHVAGDDVVQAMLETCMSNESRHKDFGAALLKVMQSKRGNAA